MRHGPYFAVAGQISNTTRYEADRIGLGIWGSGQRTQGAEYLSIFLLPVPEHACCARRSPNTKCSNALEVHDLDICTVCASSICAAIFFDSRRSQPSHLSVVPHAF